VEGFSGLSKEAKRVGDDKDINVTLCMAPFTPHSSSMLFGDARLPTRFTKKIDSI